MLSFFLGQPPLASTSDLASGRLHPSSSDLFFPCLPLGWWYIREPLTGGSPPAPDSTYFCVTSLTNEALKRD